MRIQHALALIPLAACAGQSYTYGGEPFSEYFPLDQDRYWEYRQCAGVDSGAVVDTEVYGFYDRAGCDGPEDGILRVEKFPETTTNNGIEQVTLDYYREDNSGTSTFSHSIKWSSDNSKGIRIYGWTNHITGDEFTYNPPIQVAEYQMNVGDSVTTSTGDTTFTGTFVEVRNDCPNNWGPNWDECFKLTIDAGGAEVPFDGDYWLGATYGAAAFMEAGASDVWVLDSACAQPSC